MADKIVDVLGVEIRPGDKIIYAAADGRSAVLRRGVVTDVGTKTEQESYFDRTTRTYGRRQRVSPRIRVRAERVWSGQWEDIERIVTLTFPTRIVVVDSNAW